MNTLHQTANEEGVNCLYFLIFSSSAVKFLRAQHPSPQQPGQVASAGIVVTFNRVSDGEPGVRFDLVEDR